MLEVQQPTVPGLLPKQNLNPYSQHWSTSYSAPWSVVNPL